MEVTKGMIEQWHKGPCDIDAGQVKYLGKIYKSRNVLPAETINGTPINKLLGRGWDRLGYSDMIHRDGTLENLTSYNNDNVITSDEMTWGVSGINARSRHIVLVGGKGNLMNFSDHFTEDQEAVLLKYIGQIILQQPSIIIVGHNQFSLKNCPGFFVYDWLMDHSLESYGCKKKKI
jgi:N-acetylmuramoyl-L-alanine amidase